MKKVLTVAMMLLVSVLVFVSAYAATYTVNEVSNTVIYRDTTGADSLGRDTMFKVPENGDKFVNNDDTWLMVLYTGKTTAATLSVTAQKTTLWDRIFGNITLSDITATFSGSDDRTMAFIKAPMGTYNKSDGYAYITITGSNDSLLVAPFKFKR